MAALDAVSQTCLKRVHKFEFHIHFTAFTIYYIQTYHTVLYWEILRKIRTENWNKQQTWTRRY